MSKQVGELKSAIQNLNINSPFDLRKLGKVAFSPPQNEAAQSKVSQDERTQSELARNESPARGGAEDQSPQTEVARRGGFFRLSHSVFADAELRLLSGEAFRLFIWMSSQAWRFQDSNGSLRASASYMQMGSGIAHATISRALTQLKDARLVELDRVDYKRGNIWRVCKRAVYLSENEAAQKEVPQGEEDVAPKREATHLNLRHEAAQNEAEERSINKYQEDSLSSLPENLRNYFSELRPAKKRMSEWNAFLGLRGEYPVDAIADCLALVQKRGIATGDTSSPCHSPRAYLSKAIGETIRQVDVQRLRAQEFVDRGRRDAEAHRMRHDEDAREAAEWEQKVRAFEKTFPGADRQDEVLAELLIGLPFRPNSQAGRTAAIGRWWEKLSRSERLAIV